MGAIAYLVGTIPFGLVLTRLAGLGDIRRLGSGNIGATNVLRTGRNDLAAATLALDVLKGAVPVLVAGRWGPDMALIAGAGAILGHCFPVWLRFKGGKGVASGLGVLVALAWPLGLTAVGIWLAVAAITRYSSLAALAAFLAAPGLTKLFLFPQLQGFTIALAMLILFRHVENLRRLKRGEEPKIGGRAPGPGGA
ncbi:MAG: glycerol-3-phosphate 1-O-acyltransferase PlsY [Alphaproteobacteria bacterium]